MAKGENEDFSTEFTGILALDGIQTLWGRPGDAKGKGSQFYRTVAAENWMVFQAGGGRRIAFSFFPIILHIINTDGHSVQRGEVVDFLAVFTSFLYLVGVSGMAAGELVGWVAAVPIKGRAPHRLLVFLF